MTDVYVTDAQFLLHVLEDGEAHTLNEILRRSFQERGCGLTVHSRAADLRKQGFIVINERVPGASRGRGSTYRLLGEREGSPAPPASAVVDGDGVPEQLDGQISIDEAILDGHV